MNDRQSQGHGWAIAGGIALVVAAIVVLVVLVAGGSSNSSSTSSGASPSISISRTTTIVGPTRTVTNSTSTP